MSEPQRSTEPVLITDAAMSYEDELAVRKRRYKIMMGLRVPCMILAACFYQIPWLAVTLLVLSIPLPWMAVLIANDRLPRKAEKPHRFRPGRAELGRAGGRGIGEPGPGEPRRDRPGPDEWRAGEPGRGEHVAGEWATGERGPGEWGPGERGPGGRGRDEPGPDGRRAIGG